MSNDCDAIALATSLHRFAKMLTHDDVIKESENELSPPNFLSRLRGHLR